MIYYAFGQNPPYNQSANILNSLLSNGTAGGAAVAPTPQNLNNVPFSFTPTQIQSYSLTLEQQLKRNMVGAVAYVGSQTRHLTSGVGGGNDINWPLGATSPSVPGCLPAGQAPCASYDFDPCINSGSSSSNFTRPYLGYSTINQQYDQGTANYNAFSPQSTIAPALHSSVWLTPGVRLWRQWLDTAQAQRPLRVRARKIRATGLQSMVLRPMTSPIT